MAKKFREKFSRKTLEFRRRCIQLLSALIYNANLSGFVSGSLYKGSTKGICVPGLNCYSCPGAVGSCPLGALQNGLAAIPRKFPFYVLGLLLLFGLLLGRLICGFLCPFGLIQELLYKIPSLKLKKNKWTKRLSWLKYVILAFFVIAIPIWSALRRGVPLPAFCKYICPAGTLEGGVLLAVLRPEYRALLGWLFSWKALLCLLILLGSVFIFRNFCRFFCPLGALYSLFSRVAVFGIQVDESRCTHCDICTKTCLLDVEKVGDRECVQCGKCKEKCPCNAIHYRRVSRGR